MIPDAALDATVAATSEARKLLGFAVEGCGLSARAARRVLKVAHTIADLGGEEQTGPLAVAEALSYPAGRRAGIGQAMVRIRERWTERQSRLGPLAC